MRKLLRYFITQSSIINSSSDGQTSMSKTYTIRFLRKELSIAVNKTTVTHSQGVSIGTSVLIWIRRREISSLGSRVNHIRSIRLPMGQTMLFICLTSGKNNYRRYVRINWNRLPVLRMR